MNKVDERSKLDQILCLTQMLCKSCRSGQSVQYQISIDRNNSFHMDQSTRSAEVDCVHSNSLVIPHHCLMSAGYSTSPLRDADSAYILHHDQLTPVKTYGSQLI